MWLNLRERLSVLECNILHRVKNSNHLDHSGLGLENKLSRIFCVGQVLYKILPTNLGACINQPFILFIHHIWGETVLWDTVFIIQSSDRMQYFTIFHDKLHSFNIRTINRALLAKPFKNFPKSPLRPAGSHF